MIGQVRRMAGEWGMSIIVWGAKPREIINIDEQDRDVERQQEETVFPAVGCLIFGFTRELLMHLGTDEVVTFSTDRA